LTTINAADNATEQEARIVDNINLPFVNDEAIIGVWKSIDVVNTPGEFDPERKRWQGDLYLKEYLFLEWKSGAYVIRHIQPKYYVLKR
jgi:hypothetical protein